MTTSRRAPRRSRRTVRKRTLWKQSSTLFVHTTAADIQVADLTPSPMNTTQEGSAKVLRMLGSVDLTAEGTNAAANAWALGMYVAGHEEFDQNAIAAPLGGDPQQGWYYWTHRDFQHAASGQKPMEIMLDIRTARVLRAGYKLLMVSQTPVTALIIEVRISLRTLWEIN